METPRSRKYLYYKIGFDYILANILINNEICYNISKKNMRQSFDNLPLCNLDVQEIQKVKIDLESLFS